MAPRYTLDIVFLQDSTGSQSPYIQACREAITNICQKVSAHMGSPAVAVGGTPSDTPVRFGLIAFRDHPPQDTSWVTKKYGFTPSVPEMTTWLGGLVASGGGDGPEASTAAMADALNLEWRQSKNGVKVVKIVVLITDAPPHGLGEAGDGFPDGSPDKNDPLDIARRMAERGISLYVIACEPTLSRYKHAVDFYKGLVQITSGRMLPLLNASEIGDYIIGSAVETLETEELIDQFENTILEDVYGEGKSVEAVVKKVQEQLEQQHAQIQTLQVDDIYKPSAQATANVASWASAGKLGEARDKVHKVDGARLELQFLGSFSRGMPGSAPAEKPQLPQVQMQHQAVSEDQARRLVMQGLSRHAEVGPGGKLTPKGVWAKEEATSKN